MIAPDVAAARDAALAAIKDEREVHALALDNLARLVSNACESFTAGAEGEAREAIGEALDLAYDLLGECDALEPLAAILGYVDPGESEVLS